MAAGAMKKEPPEVTPAMRPLRALSHASVRARFDRALDSADGVEGGR